MFIYEAGIDLFVNRVDLFGKPVSLNYNGKEKSKSFIGAIFSFLVFGFFVWALYLLSQDMFQKKNPKTITSESFHENPAEMIIGPDTFAFAFGLQNPETYFHYINESIYTVDIALNQLKRERQSDGSLLEVWSSVPLESEPCTPQHFGRLGSKFLDIELNELYCLKEKQSGLEELTVQGVFESPIFQYIASNIRACDNGTSGGTCGTPEEIQYYLGGGFFAVYFTNTAIDPKNYSTPNLNYRDSYYSSLTYPYYKELTLWLKHLEVKSDVGWLTEDEQVETYISFEKTVENLNFRTDKGAILTLAVRVDKIKTHYERSYTKISDVFAQVNGLGAALIIGFAFVLRPFSNIKFNESLINELFDIKDPGAEQSGIVKAKAKKNKKKKAKAEGRHLKIEVLDKGTPITVLNSPGESLTTSRLPLTKSPPFSPELEESPRKLAKLDSNIKKVECEDSRQRERGDSLSAPRRSAPPDSYSNRSQFLQYKPALVKPANKVLEHYEAQSSIEIDIVLETLIQEKKEMRRGSETCGRRSSIIDRDRRKSINKQDNEISFGDEEETSQIESVMEETDIKVKAKELPEKLLKSSYKLNITFMEYLQSFFYKSKKLKEKFRLLNEGVRRIEVRLDIFKVFKKFREVDKMRLLMFESEQLVLFDSLPKPELALKEEEGEHETEKRKSVECIRESRFVAEKRRNDLIALSYENMKKKYEKSMIDDRLLDIYDNLE